MCVLAAQSVPRFIQEFTDTYTQERETVTFECVYSGNPAPGNFILYFLLHISLFICICFLIWK